MRILGKIIDGFSFFINLGVLLIFIFSAFSDHISPLKFISPSFFGIVFPFILLVVIAFTIFWMIRFRWFVAVNIFVIIICWEPVTRYIPMHFYKQNVPQESIKVLTYNTCGMGRYNMQRPENMNQVLSFINEQNPDIVCLQEYTFNNRNKDFSERYIRSILKNYPYYHFKSASLDHTSTGLAIFSKYPITKTKGIDYNSIYNNSCLYELDINGKTVTLINNHLESNKLSPEDRKFYKDLVNNFEKNMLEEFKATLATKLAHAYKIRATQADKLNGIISNISTPIIVCGDFNDTPISYCYNRIRGDLNDAYRDSGFGPGITYHENRFLFRIDHILYNNGFKAYNAKVHHVNYSDHYPVTVYFSLEKN
ncbi:MAG: endonuclease/exonuclease/phosphatase family protein [Bacteroidales bacterium]|nr:endonuclease/exonuclease/phosphatase family protein [Bacteroidales bacterium]